ncbi:MAG: glycoside hydrolase family 25 protein [Roseibium sp.]
MTNTEKQGIDVSFWQGKINWAAVARHGIDFAIIKASEGAEMKDPRFSENWSGCKTNRISCGAYHFFLPAYDFELQSDLLVDQLQSVSFDPETDIPPAIDCEEMQGLSPTTYVSALKALMKRLEEKLKCKPMIYVSPSFWQGLRSPKMDGHPLWIANYEVDSPKIPSPWKSYRFWQYSDNGRIDGIDCAVDLDCGHLEPIA